MMKKCPYCDRPAARTADWACQWCGNPLLSKGYQTLAKTYRQLQEERRRPALSAEAEVKPEPEPVPHRKPPEPEIERRPPPRARPVVEPSPAAAEAEPQAAPKTPEAPPPPEPPRPVIAAPEPEAELKPQPASPPAEPPVMAPVPEPEKRVEAPPEEPPLALAELEEKATSSGVTVRQLAQAYEVNKAEADARLKGKTIKVSGVVGRVVAMDLLDIYYLIFTGTGDVWNIRCIFDKAQAVSLRPLSAGQTVTIQGRHSGSEKNILIKECILA